MIIPYVVTGYWIAVHKCAWGKEIAILTLIEAIFTPLPQPSKWFQGLRSWNPYQNYRFITRRPHITAFIRGGASILYCSESQICS